MATPDSTRRKAEPAAARHLKRHYVEVATARRRSGVARRPQLIKRLTQPPRLPPTHELLAQLRDVILRLDVAYSTCVTAQLALEGQNSEYDQDIARCLRLGVSDAVTTQAGRVAQIISHLGGTTRESKL